MSDRADPVPADIMTAEALAEFPNPEADAVLRYGDDGLQFGELYLPDTDEACALIVFIHGGCWMAEYDLAHCRKLARGFSRAGLACWLLEYRRVGNPGGGWPGTFEDIEAAFSHLPDLCNAAAVDPERVIAAGHSAGAHLALWIAQRFEERRRPGMSRLRGVLALAPAPDLEFLYEQGVCDGAVGKLMGGSPEEFPERYAAGSVARRIPMTTPQIAVIGRYDETWRPVGVRYAKLAAAQGAPIEVIDAPESGHFEMIDPESTTWPLVLGAAR
ncbi:MAG: alpha/beta hydrolase, partial [Woeseiaceae bacterium]|nr:alpha/beta hydrolase [Woeseiaceae bacterium]